MHPPPLPLIFTLSLHTALFCCHLSQRQADAKRTLRIFILTLIKDAYCPLRVFYQIFFLCWVCLLAAAAAFAAAASAVDAGERVRGSNLLRRVCPVDFPGSMPKKKQQICLFRVARKLQKLANICLGNSQTWKTLNRKQLIAM